MYCKKEKHPDAFSKKRKCAGCLFFNFTDGGSSKTAYRKGVSRPYGKRRSEVKGQRCETGFTGRPYNNHARCGMVIIERTRLLLQPGVGNEKLRGNGYLPAGPIIASMVPAATAVPITPATLGPIACISRKLEGLAF